MKILFSILGALLALFPYAVWQALHSVPGSQDQLMVLWQTSKLFDIRLSRRFAEQRVKLESNYLLVYLKRTKGG